MINMTTWRGLGAHLGEERKDGDARVTPYHWHVGLTDIKSLGLGHKRVGPHHIQRGHTKNPTHTHTQHSK